MNGGVNKFDVYTPCFEIMFGKLWVNIREFEEKSIVGFNKFGVEMVCWIETYPGKP